MTLPVHFDVFQLTVLDHSLLAVAGGRWLFSAKSESESKSFYQSVQQSTAGKATTVSDDHKKDLKKQNITRRSLDNEDHFN